MEKVISGLEEVIAEAVYPDRPRKFMMPLELAEDALALLKAQEPVEPYKDSEGTYYCGTCMETVVGYKNVNTNEDIRLKNYCPDCGRAVKWK